MSHSVGEEGGGLVSPSMGAQLPYAPFSVGIPVIRGRKWRSKLSRQTVAICEMAKRKRGGATVPQKN